MYAAAANLAMHCYAARLTGSNHCWFVCPTKPASTRDYHLTGDQLHGQYAQRALGADGDLAAYITTDTKVTAMELALNTTARPETFDIGVASTEALESSTYTWRRLHGVFATLREIGAYGPSMACLATSLISNTRPGQNQPKVPTISFVSTIIVFPSYRLYMCAFTIRSRRC